MGADFGGGQTSNLLALSSCVKIFVGVGALSLPSCAKYGGVIAFVIFLLFCSYVAGYCIFRLVQCSELIQHTEAKRNMYKRRISELRVLNQLPLDLDEDDVQLFDEYPQLNLTDADIEDCDKATVPLPSFKEIGCCAYGPMGGLVVDLSILVTQLGGCVAYVIFMSGALNEVFPSISRTLWVGILFIPLVLISFIRDISTLAPAATAGNLVYLYTLGVLFYMGFSDHCCVPLDELNLADYTHFTTIFGTLAFALEGIALVLPIKARMKNPKDFSFIFTGALSVVFAVYFFVGVFGYLFYGNGTKSPVISNLEPGKLADSVKVALCLCLYFSFGMQTFPNSEFWDGLLDRNVFGLDFHQLRAEKHLSSAPSSPQPNTSIEMGGDSVAEIADIVDVSTLTNNDLVPQNLRMKRFFFQNVSRVMYVVLCCFIALIFPSFHLIIALFGSLSNSLLAYILPALFYLKICSHLVLDGNTYFPYARDGSPNPFPISSALISHPSPRNGNFEKKTSNAAIVGGYESTTSSEDEPTTAMSRSNSNSSTTSKKKLSQSPPPNNGLNLGELDPLFSTSQVQRSEIKLNASNCAVFGMSIFPYTVAVLGSIASAIGVTMAVKDLIAEFGQQE